MQVFSLFSGGIPREECIQPLYALNFACPTSGSKCTFCNTENTLISRYASETLFCSPFIHLALYNVYTKLGKFEGLS